MYGEKENPEFDFYTKRKRDLDERLGNAFLKLVGKEPVKRKVNLDKAMAYMKKYDRFKPKNSKRTLLKNTPSKYTVVDKITWKAKQKEQYLMESEFDYIIQVQNKRSMNAYKQMMEDVERTRISQDGSNLYSS